jgi:hypothetical protein
MNFRKATDDLLAGPTLADLAAEIGASVQAVRQARADEASKGFRVPPEGWEAGVIRLANERIKRLNRLIKGLS